MTSPIILALDLDSKEALNLADMVYPSICRLKVGSQLFTSSGPDIVKRLQDKGFEIFLDLKFHDIPNTVNKTVKVAGELGVWMINVHASGGSEMLEAAYSANEDKSRPLLVGVTLLTSMNEKSAREIGFNLNPSEQVIHLTRLCKAAGLSGVVCSSKELISLRKEFGKDFILVAPGIRSVNSLKHDQKRTSTPIRAIKDGANYIVLGREVTLEKDPLGKMRQILENIS